MNEGAKSRGEQADEHLGRGLILDLGTGWE